jgi:L-threonylcarbamoyladenylate synthase
MPAKQKTETTRLKVSEDAPDKRMISQAADVLRNGGLVAFPTETVYGLGADAFNEQAVDKVFIAKGRPNDNPLIVHIADSSRLRDVCAEIPPKAKRLAEKFMPGPLTLVLKAREEVPANVRAHLDTVAVRVPNHSVARALIRELGRGVVGPSANQSGRPSPTTAQHVIDDLAGRIDMVLDAGPTTIGLESTVLDVTSDPPAILRHGGLSQEEIEKFLGPVQSGGTPDALRRSPGTRYRHYAPKAEVVVVNRGDAESFKRAAAEHKGMRLACIVHTPAMIKIAQKNIEETMAFAEDSYARNIFAALRMLDMNDVEVIIVEAVDDTGLGRAVMDRLKRAAQG